MKKLLGVVGETASGKDAFCEYIKKNFPKVFVMRFSDPLYDALKIFLDEKRKEDLQWIAIVLRERFGNDIIWKAVKKRIEGIKTGIVVLNGIRFPEEFKGIKKLGGKIVYVTAPSKLRWERIRKRGEKKDDNVSYEEFLRIERAKTELQIPALGKKADFIIDNSGTLEEFKDKTKEVLEKI
jgi:dephospho-CoA kinase